MAKGWHNKHISTKLGVIILGFLLFSGILLVTVLDKTQIFQSHAGYVKSVECYKTTRVDIWKNGRKETKFITLPCLATPTPKSCKSAGGTCGRVCGRERTVNNKYSCEGSNRLNCCLPKK